mgnify:CR=1 FL=1
MSYCPNPCSTGIAREIGFGNFGGAEVPAKWGRNAQENREICWENGDDGSKSRIGEDVV